MLPLGSKLLFLENFITKKVEYLSQSNMKMTHDSYIYNLTLEFR